MRLLASFGGKRALVTTLWTPLRLGWPLRQALTARLPAGFVPKRLVFVCMGNICRSPFAEALARHAGYAAISRGLRADPASGADATAIDAARAFGIDMSGHRARPFDPAEIGHGDLVLAFEAVQVQELQARLKDRDATVRLLGAYAGPLCWHLHDPYGLGPLYFRRCFGRIERSLAALVVEVGLTSKR